MLGLNETKTSVLLFCGTSDVVCLTVALLLFPFNSYYSQDVKLRPELSGSTFESGLAIKEGKNLLALMREIGFSEQFFCHKSVTNTLKGKTKRQRVQTC